MEDREKEIRQKLKNDFEHYSSKCLKIVSKSGSLEQFKFNAAQRHLHNLLQKQFNEKGKVRAIILKGRQQGCSTYIEGRFYWLVTHRKGAKAFILTHHSDATNNLFDMAQRYHANCPAVVRPKVDTSNAKELNFGLLDSGYKVGTAGTKALGRSSTIQLFHGSEVAYWPNAYEHAKGILQAIPDEPGTEIFLESTANGIGNFFHEQWQKAESGLTDYIPIFIPWFWQEEYRKQIPAGFSLSEKETEYKAAYQLDNEQMAWRRSKVEDLKDEWQFKQEYPATAAEAFETSGIDSFVDAELVIKARKTETEPYGAKVMGVDVAGHGKDKTAIAIRQGRVIHQLLTYHDKNTMEVAAIVANLIKEESPDRVFIDVGGLGVGVYDRLSEMGYSSKLTPINFGQRPLNAERFINKRTEMWGLMKEWFEQEIVQIPDNDSLHADLTMPLIKQHDSLSRPVFYTKDELRKKGIRSPDEGDACALTFAFPVINEPYKFLRTSSIETSDSSWMGA